MVIASMFLTPSQKQARRLSVANEAMTSLFSVADKGTCVPLYRDEYISKCIEVAGQGYNKFNRMDNKTADYLEKQKFVRITWDTIIDEVSLNRVFA